MGRMIIGPQSVLLSRAVGVPHVSTGELFRALITRNRSICARALPLHRSRGRTTHPDERPTHRGTADRTNAFSRDRRGQPRRSRKELLVLTLANAAVVLHHEPVAPPSLGYTRTMHHSLLIDPGDLWRPNPDEHPRTVRSIDRFEGRLTITDENGHVFHYPSDGLLPTAVADPGPAHIRLPPTWTHRRKRERREGSGRGDTREQASQHLSTKFDSETEE